MPDIQMAPYVLGAYIGAWLVLTGYVAYLAVKVSQVKKELVHLSDTLKKS
ncbi:MAG: CcmD family protein [Actinomycetota bacterium]